LIGGCYQAEENDVNEGEEEGGGRGVESVTQRVPEALFTQDAPT